MQTENTRNIKVLLTEDSKGFSKWLKRIIVGKYSHASIGIEGTGRYFFSFIKKGFGVESPLMNTRTVKSEMPCALYSMDVTEEAYAALKERIDEFRANKGQYHYSFLGVILCLLRIPHRIKNSYFCSQFVSELLTSSGAAELKKRPSLYLPKDFTNESQLQLCFRGTLGGLADIIRNDYVNLVPLKT